MRKLLTENPIFLTDSYKYSHYLQYPQGTSEIYSYTESRGGHKEIVYFGMQYFIKKYLMNPITMDDIDQAEPIILAHGEPFNRYGFEKIVKQYGGYFPITVKALPEGLKVPAGVPTSVMYNEDPDLAWVTNWWETIRLQKEWSACEVASRSWRVRQKALEIARKTSDDPEAAVAFMLHDFGFRGVSGVDAAALCGMAHLLSFMGTDTTIALAAAIDYYNAKGPVGFSIPATEHSTMSAYGRDGEAKAVSNMITQFGKPGSMFAAVGDTYDYYNFINEVVGKQCKQQLIDSGGKLVTRPDSGEAATIAPDTCEIHGFNFGYKTNSKGYKVLAPCIGGIWGDGMNEETVFSKVVNPIVAQGWAIENFAEGMGGKLLQGIMRDDGQWATKASSITINGQEHDIYKDPITDKGKVSKRGKFAVVAENGKLTCKPAVANEWQNEMRTVYKNGRLLVDEDFETIRSRAKGQF